MPYQNSVVLITKFSGFASFIDVNKSSWELMLGQHAVVLVNVIVHNLRESAYEAQLFVSHPTSLSYIGLIKAKVCIH